MKKINILWAILILILSSCSEKKVKTSRVEHLPYYQEATFTPFWLKEGDELPNNFHKISDFKLTNQDGETITRRTLEGKIYIADFFFTTCPGICPKMTANMSLLQDEFLKNDDILLLSHSVTPSQDSVPVLKRHAEGKNIISGKWHLLTGKRETIYSLGRNNYFVEEDLGIQKSNDDFLHTENFILIDKNQHIRGIYNGLNKTALSQLITDVKTLQKES